MNVGFFRCKGGAFTIVELLVATAVSLLLIGILLSVTSNVMSSYKRAEGEFIRQGDVAFALDQIVQDLEGIVTPNVIGAEGLRSTPEEVGPEEAASHWLTFLSTATDSDNSSPVTFSGATRAISYRLAYQNPIDGGSSDASYAIYRSIATAQHTFDNAIDKADLQAEYWTSLAAVPAPSPLPPTDLDNFLAGNVVRFDVRFLRGDTNEWTSSDENIRLGRDGATVNGVLVEGGFKRAEVAITVLTPAGMERLRSGLSLGEAITKFGHTSVRQTAFF